MKKLYLTVTNDLNFDQRMNRICNTLAQHGYDVTLVGRKLRSSLPLQEKQYKQKRLNCLFNKGPLFYAEFNLRIFFFLLFRRMDLICAIDLDTILPCLFVSRIKKVQRVYDAHELFSELKEVITRGSVQKIWLRIERYAVPKFTKGYTVSEGIASEFKRRYGVEYETIRNVPALRSVVPIEQRDDFILYQGAVNEGRGLEWLIPAMKLINSKLVVCGDGNFMEKLKALIGENGVEENVELKGLVSPHDLYQISTRAKIGIALAEREGLNQYLALPNKFFDYIHARLPQVTMNYPEYRQINDRFNIAILIDDLKPETIAMAVNGLLDNDDLRQQLSANCKFAIEELNWDREKYKLLNFYERILPVKDR